MKHMHQCFGLSKQGFYKRFKSYKTKINQDKIVAKLVIEQRKITGARTGGIKLYKALKPTLEKLHIKLGRDKFYAVLRRERLLVKRTKNYHVTTNSKHRFYKYPNLVKDKVPTRPEQLWVSDITYIKTQGGHSYLALVTDAYSKKIMGYKLANHMKASLCTDALKMALSKRQYPDKKLIHHSDRGFQYCSNEYVKLAESKKISLSMTQQYDPYENAIAERINGTLKQEYGLNLKIPNIGLAKKMIKQAVDIYNNKRLHLSLDLQTPQFEHTHQTIKYKSYAINQNNITNLLI